MNSQYLNQHYQNTVETVTAMTNVFFKQKSEIKHMHTMVVVVVKIFVCLHSNTNTLINTCATHFINLCRMLLTAMFEPEQIHVLTRQFTCYYKSALLL